MTTRFDAVSLLDQYGDHALVRELARLFISSADAQTALVSAAVEQRDARALGAAAHRLRGGLATIGATHAAERARRLESMGASGDLAGADEIARQLGDDIRSLCGSAATWLAEHDG